MKHVKHGFEGSADRYCILSSHKTMTVTMTVDTGTPPVYDGPPSSLFLKLCGDVESNPGPSTDELIEELGRTLGIRLDTISTDMQSLRTTITSMSVQISVLTERLQKKEEDIEEMKSRTKGLDGRLKKIKEVEQQQITSRQDKTSSESQRRGVGKVAMTVRQPWLHSLTSTTRSDGGRVTTWPGFKGWGRRREKPIDRGSEAVDHAQSWSGLSGAATSDDSSPAERYAKNCTRRTSP